MKKEIVKEIVDEARREFVQIANGKDVEDVIIKLEIMYSIVLYKLNQEGMSNDSIMKLLETSVNDGILSNYQHIKDNEHTYKNLML